MYTNAISDEKKREQSWIVWERSFLDSTQTFAKNAVRTGVDNILIVAHKQTAGRGRRGRVFYSPENGLYFTASFPDLGEQSELVTPAAAVAIACTLEEMYSMDVQIKWVNDIFYRGKKVAGILTERYRRDSDHRTFLLCGIGINVGSPSFGEDLPMAGGLNLSLGTDEKIVLAYRIADQLKKMMAQFPDSSFLREYQRRLLGLGQPIVLSDGRKGILDGIDDRASLLFRDDSGAHIVRSGEIRLIEWRNE